LQDNSGHNGRFPIAGATDLPAVALLDGVNAPIVGLDGPNLKHRGQELP
jgi:hypothetical protein